MKDNLNVAGIHTALDILRFAVFFILSIYCLRWARISQLSMVGGKCLQWVELISMLRIVFPSLAFMRAPSPHPTAPLPYTLNLRTIINLPTWSWGTWQGSNLPSTGPPRLWTYTESVTWAATPPSWLWGAGAIQVGAAGGAGAEVNQEGEQHQQHQSHLQYKKIQFLLIYNNLCLETIPCTGCSNCGGVCAW